MQFGAAVPTYSGNIHAQDINLQLLTGSKSLGKATFNATVEGAGFNLKDLEENLSASVANLEFKGYRSRHVQIEGVVDQKLFEAEVVINDPILQLDRTCVVKGKRESERVEQGVRRTI